MKVEIEIDESVIPSLDMYRRTQVKNEPHNLTRANTVVFLPGHETNEDMIKLVVKAFIDQLLEKYPTGERLELLKESERLKEQIKNYNISSRTV